MSRLSSPASKVTLPVPERTTLDRFSPVVEAVVTVRSDPAVSIPPTKVVVAAREKVEFDPSWILLKVMVFERCSAHPACADDEGAAAGECRATGKRNSEDGMGRV